MKYKVNKKHTPHTISVADLQEWRSNEKVLYAADSNSKKRLYFALNGNFILEVDGKEVWRGIQPFTACEQYNKY